MKATELGLVKKENVVVNLINGESIVVKPYLTTPEIGVIVAECVNIEDVVIRQQIVDEYVLKICAMIEVDTIEEYDLLKQNGVIEAIYGVIENAGDLQGFLYEAQEMGNLTRIGLNKIVETLDVVIDKIPKDDKAWAKAISFVTSKIKGATK